MAIHFLLDKEQRREDQTIAEILSVTRKQPYPTKDATHLATFLEACFEVEHNKRIKKEHKKKVAEAEKRRAIQEKLRKEQEAQKLKQIEAAAPVPIPEAPKVLDKKEYVINIYKRPVGILVEKDQHDKFEYHAVQPHIAPPAMEYVEGYLEKFKEKPQLLDDYKLLTEIAKKAYAKAGETFNDHSTDKVAYYLQRDTLGTGPIDPLVFDENVQTIFVDGPKKPVQVEYSNYGKIKTNIVYQDNEHINRLIRRLASETHKVVNMDNPILDVTVQGLKIESTLGIGGANSRITIRRL